MMAVLVELILILPCNRFTESRLLFLMGKNRGLTVENQEIGAFNYISKG